MTDRSRSALREYGADLATVGSAIVLLGLLFHYVFGFAESEGKAALALAVVWVYLFAMLEILKLAGRKWQAADGSPRHGLAFSGYWASFTFTIIVSLCGMAGYFAHPFLTGSAAGTSPQPEKPPQVVLDPARNADSLNITQLVPYRSWLATRSEGMAIKLVESQPIQGPTAEFDWTFGPENDIETAFAFVVPTADPQSRSIAVLPIARTTKGNFAVEVPAFAAPESFRIVLLVQARKETNFYSGGVQ